MRPWRDIFTAETLHGMRKNRQYVGQTGGRTVFGGPSKESHLKKLEKAICDYHYLDKTSANMIDLRQNMLLDIHIMASQWFTLFKINKGQAAARVNHGLDPTGESLNRNILTLERRALRKKDYLEKLKIYCRTANPQALLDYINSPRIPNDEFLDLVPKVRMEREDFMHRNGYEAEDCLMHQAFEEWAQGNHRIPFFLWLENHPVCRSETKSGIFEDVKSVQYFDDRTTVDPKAKFRIVTGPPLVC